ncbi:MAG: DUF3592 domain-containing protein [bacterium]|nr:DUF3592 domain-containing protein [bacterium]MDI1337121.1 DUF3592 domain-containing protein [Lacunisphaera sp.]
MKVTADDIAQLLAAAPPRPVPAHITKAVGGGCAAWFLPLFGLVFGGLGLVFVVIFFPWQFLDEWRLAGAEARTTGGVITEVSRTSMSINKVRVMEYVFRYTPAGGPPRQGRSYTTGERWQKNAAVTVRYLPADPALARVEGARLGKSSWGGVFVIIFPLLGGAFVTWFFVNRRRTGRLLHEGLVTEVDVQSVDETTMRVNHQTVYRIVIAAPSLNNGQPVTVKRVNQADVNLALKHVRDKQPIYVLYDPRNHTRVLFPEALIDP